MLQPDFIIRLYNPEIGYGLTLSVRSTNPKPVRIFMIQCNNINRYKCENSHVIVKANVGTVLEQKNQFRFRPIPATFYHVNLYSSDII